MAANPLFFPSQNVSFEQANNVADTKHLLTQVGIITRTHAQRLQAAMRGPMGSNNNSSTVLA